MRVPDGWLPAFAVGDEREAEELLTFACQTNLRGEFYATELAQEQTLANLDAFGERLRVAHDYLRERLGAKFCRCVES